MFLLTSENLKRETALHKSLSAPVILEDPEHDAIAEIERFKKLFLHGTDVHRYGYSVEDSAKTAESSGERLRAIGAATYERSNALGCPGPLGGREWLIDGLAKNLLRNLLSAVTIRTAPAGALRKATAEVSFSELMRLIGSSSQWDSVKSKANIREREYLISGEGIDERLIFLGHPLGLSPSTGMVSGVKMWGRGKPRSLAGGNLKRAINGIFEDQNRRITLSYEYDQSPEANALPAPLRAEIKRALEAVGIPNGSYSREGFSSGKFPYRFTYAPIQDSQAGLIFSRCSNCRSVKSLSIENGSYDQLRTVWELTETHISPWHERICGSERYTTATRSRLSFKDQLWELKWLGAGILN